MKKTIVILSIIALAGMSGCIGVEEFTASEPSINNQTLDDTGFEKASNETININESREILGSKRGAKITSHVAVYEKKLVNSDLDVSEQSIEDVNVSRILEATDTDPLDYATVENVANESDQLTEEDIRFILESQDTNLKQVAEQNNVDLDDLVTKERIIQRVGEEKIKEEIQSNTNTDTPSSIYTVVSTPSAGILGTELNPLVQAPTDEIVNIVKEQNNNQNLEIGNRTDSYTIEDGDGNVINVEKYDVTINSGNGQEIDGKLHISTKTDSEGGDVLLMAGIYPNLVQAQSDIDEMMISSST